MQPEKKREITRRVFLGDCAACAAGITVLGGFAGSVPVFGGPFPVHNKEKAKVRVIFAYPDPAYPNWPNIGYDFEGKIVEYKALFARHCPDTDFEYSSVMSGSEETARKILEQGAGTDGYIVFLVGCLWGSLTETIAASGVPTLIVDHLYAGSGEFLTSFAAAKRAGHKVIAVSSSRFEDVAEAVRCFGCLKKLRTSTILVVGNTPDTRLTETYGTAVRKIEFSEINDSYGKVDPAEAGEWARRWIKKAARVIEPPREEVEKAAAMYLAMAGLMSRYNAQAVTINCLGGIYSEQMVCAYPCLGFMQLDDDGFVGACESDQRSTATKLLMTYLAGRPGFISDPVIDTSKNRIIYAHCVAPTKVFGPSGRSNPYHIRDHSEDRKGACNRSLMPLGEMTTTVMFDHGKKQVIFHQGKTVENVDDDKACRNKLAVEVKGDIYKLLNEWDRWGWHRVTFYGDLKRQVFNIAALLGFEVVEEA